METTQSQPVSYNTNTYQLTAEDIARISAKKAMEADIKKLVEQHKITKELRKTGTQTPGTDYTSAHIAAARYQAEREELYYCYVAYAELRHGNADNIARKDGYDVSIVDKILAKYGR